MRVSLMGIASATKILASGEKVTYYYAWRGGPKLLGKPGSPEFVQSYEKAHRERHAIPHCSSRSLPDISPRPNLPACEIALKLTT
jgi:hypothetical protein